MHDFQSVFDTYVETDDILVLAVSGGVDSMVLFDLVKRHHPIERIVVAHFDHSLRATESDGDREFIANICDSEGIRFEVEKMDIATLARDEKMSIESVARKYRYAFLSDVALRYGARSILTAHHQDDRIETMLFHLIRGTKLGGLHALKVLNPIDMTSTLFRPLLSVRKTEILDYAAAHNIAYREDATNQDTGIQRNYLRHEVIPRFVEINPEYHQALENFIEYTEGLKGWIDDEVSLFLGDGRVFSVSDFSRKSPFFQKEIMRYLYEQAHNGTIGLSEGGIDELLRYIMTAEGGTVKNIGNLTLRKQKGQIVWREL